VKIGSWLLSRAYYTKTSFWLGCSSWPVCKKWKNETSFMDDELRKSLKVSVNMNVYGDDNALTCDGVATGSGVFSCFYGSEEEDFVFLTISALL